MALILMVNGAILTFVRRVRCTDVENNGFLSLRYFIALFALFCNFSNIFANFRTFLQISALLSHFFDVFLYGYERGTGYPVALMVSVLSKVADFKADFNFSDY